MVSCMMIWSSVEVECSVSMNSGGMSMVEVKIRQRAADVGNDQDKCPQSDPVQTSSFTFLSIIHAYECLPIARP